MTAFNFIDQLKQQLSQFGLNPAEWNIVPQDTHSTYFRVTKIQAELTLIGRICTQSGAWLELNYEGIE